MVRVFASEAAARAHADADAAARGYPCAGEPAAPYPYGWTLRWDDVRQHPARAEWAYNADGSPLPCPADATEMPALPADWMPQLTG